MGEEGKLEDIVLKEVDELMLKAGFADKTKSVCVTTKTRKEGKWGISTRLEKLAVKNGFGHNVTNLLAAAGWKSGYVTTTQETFQESLRKAYPLNKVIGLYGGQNIKLPAISELRKQEWHRKEHDAYTRKINRNSLPSVRELVNGLYPELHEMFPGSPPLYDLISRKVSVKSTNTEKIKSDLLQIYREEGDISPAGGLRENHRLLFRFVDLLRKNDKIYHLGTTKTEVISNLTGINSSEFVTSTQRKVKKIGTLGEQLTRMLLMMTMKLDPEGKRQTEKFRETFPLPILKVTSSNGSCVEDDRGEYFLPDIIVNDSVAEVKVAKTKRKATVEKIKKQLGGGRNLYLVKGNERRIVSSRIAVIHGHEKIVRGMEDSLLEEGIGTFNSRDFEDSLETGLELCEGRIKLPLAPKQLADLYQKMAYSSHLLLKDCQRKQLEYALHIIREINRMLCGESEIKIKTPKVFGNKGKTESNEKGLFSLYRIPITDLGESKTLEYVLKNMASAWQRDKLFLDLETAGLGMNDQIISAGLAYRDNRSLRIDIAFARNPLEEAALLQHLNDKINGHHIIVTYNGRSFDLKRIKSRCTAHLLEIPKMEPNIDVYTQCFISARKKLRLRNSKLGQIDLLCGSEREDIAGKQVPVIYRQYIFCDADISPVLEHNALDMVSLIAAFIFAKKELGYRL